MTLRAAPLLLLTTFASGCLFAPTPYIPPAYVEPELEFVTPSAGDWLGQGQVEVQGVARGLENITLDGQPVTVDADGHFLAAVDVQDGIHLLELRGTEPDGDVRFARQSVMVGSYAPADEPLHDAARLRLNSSGLDFALQLAEQQVRSADVQAMALAANPVYQEDMGLFQLRADVQQVSFGALQLDATPDVGVIHLRAVIPSVLLSVPVSARGFFFNADAVATASANQAIVTGDLTLDAVDGEPVLQLTGVDIAFQGLQLHTQGLPSPFDQLLVGDVMDAALRELLPQAIASIVPQELALTLRSMNLSFGLNLLGSQLTADASFGSFTIAPDGIEASVDVAVSTPGAGALGAPGFLRASAPPSANHVGDVSLGLSDSLVNLLLFQAWSAGSLDMDLPLNLLGGEQPIANLIGDGTLHVRPVLPPVVVERQGLQAQIGELGLAVDTPSGNFGEHIELAASLTSAVGVSDALQASGGQGLALALGSPEMQLAARASDWGAIDAETLTNMLEVVVPVDAVLAAFSGVEVPFPEVRGLAIGGVDVHRSASQSDTDIVLSLTTP